ncbi:MAG TPA: PHB depolymerase family esterase, partial [Candidatus Melainabacteria bacterium]|nr:PHB depolymerase family esterase [Candidatus Melainabacteria bacterium]
MTLFRNVALLSLSLAFLCLPGWTSPLPAPEKKQEIARRCVKSIKVGKIRRSYVVNTPAGYGAKPAPLVLVLHGAMANTFAMAWDTRMTEKANEHGFIVVYPRGIGIAKTLMTWNAGDCCGIAKLRNIDDIAFLKTLIKQLRQD